MKLYLTPKQIRFVIHQLESNPTSNKELDKIRIDLIEHLKCKIKMSGYTIYCTTEQTCKALQLDAPITIFSDTGYIPDDTAEKWHLCKLGNETYCIPTAEQILGWLEEQGVHISIIYDDCTYRPEVRDVDDGFINNDEYFNSRQEATLVAIDVALKYLSNEK